MPQVFSPSADTWLRLGIVVGAVTLSGALLVAGGLVHSDYGDRRRHGSPAAGSLQSRPTTAPAAGEADPRAQEGRWREILRAGFVAGSAPPVLALAPTAKPPAAAALTVPAREEGFPTPASA